MYFFISQSLQHRRVCEKVGKEMMFQSTMSHKINFIMRHTGRDESKYVLNTAVQIYQVRDFPGGAVVKNPPANAGDTRSSPAREDPTCRRATKPVCHKY